MDKVNLTETKTIYANEEGGGRSLSITRTAYCVSVLKEIIITKKN